MASSSSSLILHPLLRLPIETSNSLHLPFSSLPPALTYSLHPLRSISNRHIRVPFRIPSAPRNGHDPCNFDDHSIISDMGAYSNQLSFEYRSVWDTKPAWCQPWTILLTGFSIIVGSWLALHIAFVTTFVTFAIGIWWFAFLYAYPQAYTRMIAERSRRACSQKEDTLSVQKLEH